ncbi:Hsp20/alpha crystallin family protein [Ancylostoma ceylanicum]|uniref:Hsp20/alpha crystallin family protein n=2 Tax=Ancylostoma ceylanicum TaxID=53326 RepID=A0A0D6LMV8_9BILA|nr:Hsp20/alpha crystallin family protein [Ancylostoma ceylanicum]EYC20192.1 hypothetical protein Y032_0022g501 [Ancylostoma ceylanicum]
MALWPVPRFDRTMRDLDRFGMPLMTRDQDWFGRQLMPYWRDDDHSVLHVGFEVMEVVNDEKKFAIELGVSHFKPEELEVHIESRDLTIEGKYEEKSDHDFIKRSFVRRWALPEVCEVRMLSTLSSVT